MRTHHESGQMIFTSLVLLLSVSLVGLYFLYLAENAKFQGTRQNSARVEALKQANEVATILNQIAINNKNILAASAIAVNSHVEAYQLGLMLSLTREHWETHSWQRRLAVLSNPNAIVARPFLDALPRALPFVVDEKIESVFTTFNRRSARALQIAQGLTAINRKLKRKLAETDLRWHQLLSESLPEDTLCLATQTGATKHKVRFQLNPCGLKAKGELSYYNGNVFEVSEMTRLWVSKVGNNDNTRVALLYAKPQQLQTYLDVTSFSSKPNAEGGSGHQAVQKFVRSSFVALLTEAETSRLPLSFESFISHPDFILNDGCTGAGKNIFVQQDYMEAKRCGLKTPLFIRAFMKPHFAPLILNERKQGAIL